MKMQCSLAILLLAFALVRISSAARHSPPSPNDVPTGQPGDSSLPPPTTATSQNVHSHPNSHPHLPPHHPRGRRQAEATTNGPVLLADPQLPPLPEPLANMNPDCLLWHFVQTKLLGMPAVQRQIQKLCMNGTAQGDWCQVDLQVVIKQADFGATNSLLRVDPEILEDVQDLHIFVQFTQNGGIWQVVALPRCADDANNEASSSSDDGEDDNNVAESSRFVARYLF